VAVIAGAAVVTAGCGSGSSASDTGADAGRGDTPADQAAEPGGEGGSDVGADVSGEGAPADAPGDQQGEAGTDGVPDSAPDLGEDTGSSPITEIRLFATGPHDGDLGGRSGADELCVAAATGWATGKKAHALGSFSDGDQASTMPAMFGFPVDVPIRGLDGSKTISATWAGLFDGGIDVTLADAGVLFDDFWTGSDTTGGHTTLDCAGFTTTKGTGTCGTSGAKDETWISYFTPGCTLPLPLVCVAY